MKGFNIPPDMVLVYHSSDIEKLLAYWSIYRASEAGERAMSASFDTSEAKLVSVRQWLPKWLDRAIIEPPPAKKSTD